MLGETLRAARRLLQRDGFPEERAAKILEVETIVNVLDRIAEFDADMLVSDPRHMPFGGRSIEQRQDNPLVNVRDSSVKDADFGASFGQIDEIGVTPTPNCT